MDQLLATAGMGMALAFIVMVAGLSAAFGVLSEPASVLGTRVRRSYYRHELSGTQMPGMLGRLGLTLAQFCEERSPAELRESLDRCRTCPAGQRCREDQMAPRAEASSFAYCPNRRSR